MTNQPKPQPEAEKKLATPTPTTPAEEWGDRVETGRDIARGGKDQGEVPGATGDEPTDPRSGNDKDHKKA